MSQEPINYEAVLSDLEAKKAALDVAIAAIRQVVSLGAQASVGGGGAVPAGRPIDPLDIPGDAFFGLSIGEAVKKYLTMVKKRQTVKEIADALERGGLPHTSADFAGTVRVMVNRQAKTDQELVRVGPGSWGLSAWYGNRRPKEPASKPARAKKRREKKASAKRQAVEPEPVAIPVAKTGLTLVQQAAVVLRESGEPLSAETLIARIQARFHRKVTRATLVGILAEKVRKQEIFVRPEPNRYGLLDSTEATLH